MKQIPSTGVENSAFRSFDVLLERFMSEKRIPGASLAVTCQGRLVYARGYGWSDRDARTPYAPTDLFRIASVSKPITSAAVCALVEDGKLDLEEKAFARLALPAFVAPNVTPDARLKNITVRHLLQHTAGFDRARSFDPMFVPARISAALGVASPPTAANIVHYMQGIPLDFTPGSAFAYSNFGYCVLGRLIERVAGKPYDVYVKERVLAPAGITRMRTGRSRLAERAPGEVRYYDGDTRQGRSVFAADRGASLPTPYGAWCIEAMDAHGGWLGSSIDLVRFAAALDAKSNRVLQGRTRRMLYEHPSAPVGYEASGAPSAAYYGLGWNVRPTRAGGANYWHMGKLDGSATLLVRRDDGLSWAVNFNTESVSGSLAGEIDAPLHGAANAVPAWPSHNLFGKFDG